MGIVNSSFTCTDASHSPIHDPMSSRPAGRRPRRQPILARPQRAGWLVKEIEPASPAAAGRPVRRFYLLASGGLETARIELARLGERLRLVPGPLLPEGGHA
ncbi:MAG: hypothetical protein ACRDP6_31915 [Actinoallomurus sp.]